jgi:hypothetical protein
VELLVRVSSINDGLLNPAESTRAPSSRTLETTASPAGEKCFHR